MDTDVVVVGGGPVGLTVAALLHRAGRTVRVLERRADPAGQSRATTIHPRTLEVLDAVATEPGPSLAARMVEAGHRLPDAHFAALPHRLPYARLDTSFPFVLMLPQPTTERLLAEHLAGAGVAVERGREIVGVDQDDDGVTVTTGDGEQVRGRYVIGADGARSAVRTAVGIDFPGTPATQAGFLADVHLDRPPSHLHHWDPDTGSYTVMPLPGDVYRIFGNEPGDTLLAPEQARERLADTPDEVELRAILHRVAGDDFGLREVLWTSRAGDETRHAERYRQGRVFLAGDAAHVHLPAGGQGLNVGVQDAANLAWKLAAELAGRAPRRIAEGPQSFDAERRPIAEQLRANTLAQAAIMTTFSPAGAALRDMMDGLIVRDGDTADELRGWLSGLELAYDPPGDGAQAAPAGRRVPDLPLTDGCRLHRVLPPDRCMLVGLTTDPPADDRVPTVRSGREWAGASAVLVRPDGYAAAVWHAAPEVADVHRVVGEWTSAAVPADVS